ncbi:putative reverse transcriptase/RNA-dependent DNA polymerase [Citrus sinensis]|nr:putative reverse transcriptase/RNA-dependent DNA polymerase [Citrus sinensis]
MESNGDARGYIDIQKCSKNNKLGCCFEGCQRFGPHFVEERLDKFMCSRDWVNNFYDHAATNLLTVSFDNCPVLMEVRERGKSVYYERKAPRRIHYEDIWSAYETCKSIVQEEWSSQGNWKYGNPVLQFQKSTKSSMAKLKWWKEEAEVEAKFCEYFQEIFTSSRPNQAQIDAALAGLLPKITEDMKNQLNQPFTAENISEALNQMCLTKAPGLDGLPDVFFQKHWQAVECGIVSTCLHTLNERESFSNLLLQAEQNHQFQGLKFGKEITISHLLFADNSLVLTKASVDSCKALKAIFDRYAAASGQLFNFDKSSMIFSGKIPGDRINAIKSIFQLKHKFFLSGRKEVLIKAVAQAVPVYTMIIFKLPIGLCDDIQMAMAKFWWRSKEDKCGIHWARWEKMSQAKSRGGLGFREMSSFNQALVAKQGWRLLQYPHLLVTKVLKARCCKKKFGGGLAIVNRFIFAGIIGYQGSKPLGPSQSKIYQQKLQSQSLLILKTSGITERLYAVKSGYQLALKMKYLDKPSCSYKSFNHWNRLWTLQLPEKIKIFMWRASQNLLPTDENLWKKKILVEPYCQVYKQGVESVSHVLVHCKVVRKVWVHAPFEICFPDATNQDMWSVMLEITKKLSKSDIEIFVAYCWAIWYGRNHKIFYGKKMGCCRVVAKAEAVVEAYKQVSQQRQGSGGMHNPMKSQKWCPPSVNVFKANMAAAINYEKGIAGLGAVIRYSNSRIIVATIKTTQFTGDVKAVEAEAVE